MRNLTIIALLFSCTLCSAQSPLVPQRIWDINPNGTSSPYNLTVAGTNLDQLIFEGSDMLLGTNRLLYIARSSTTGVQLVIGSAPATGHLALIAAGGEYIFSSVLREMPSGPVGLENTTPSQINWFRLSPEEMGSTPTNIVSGVPRGAGVVFGNRLIAGGYSPATGYKPFLIDPVTNTSSLLRQLEAGPAGSAPARFMSHNNKVYFTARSTTTGMELYTSDGTIAGTILVKDALAGAPGSDPWHLTSTGGRLYFSALANAGNREPWSSNGSTAGTVKLKEINPSTTVGSDPREFTALGTKVFFTADNGSNGRELWVTDGTTIGTILVKDLITGPTGSNPHDLVVYNQKLWFVATDAGGLGRSLYSSDGTAVGTLKIQELPRMTDGENLHACNGKLFYVVRGSGISQMWSTTGSTKSTRQVLPSLAPNTNPIGVTRAVVMKNWLYFVADFDATGAEVWKVQ